MAAPTTIPLREIAFARSGDKGNSANVAVFARTPAAYAWLREHLTAASVETFFKPLGVGTVTRYEVPNLEALNFILPDILAGGGSRSLRIDSQGKTLGMALLEMPVAAAILKPHVHLPCPRRTRRPRDHRHAQPPGEAQRAQHRPP
jgi:hypothetical protein